MGVRTEETMTGVVLSLTGTDPVLGCDCGAKIISEVDIAVGQ
jgi:hypothetical protein